jgi:hypothetical protein
MIRELSNRFRSFQILLELGKNKVWLLRGLKVGTMGHSLSINLRMHRWMFLILIRKRIIRWPLEVHVMLRTQIKTVNVWCPLIAILNITMFSLEQGPIILICQINVFLLTFRPLSIKIEANSKITALYSLKLHMLKWLNWIQIMLFQQLVPFSKIIVIWVILVNPNNRSKKWLKRIKDLFRLLMEDLSVKGVKKR